MGPSPPPLPIVPSQSGVPRATGTLAQSGHSSDPSAAINSFMNNFLTMRQAMKDDSRKKFMEGVQLAAQGIPVDNQKLIKYAKKGGMDFLQTEPTDPGVTQQMQQYHQAQQAGQAAAQTVPQSISPADTAALQGQAQAAQGQAPPQQAPPQQPSLMRRIGQGLGILSPQVAPNAGKDSPMGQWLTGLQQAGGTAGGMVGQLQRQNSLAAINDHLSGMSAQQKAQIMQMGENVVAQGPNYLQDQESLQRMGVLKELPIDDLVTTADYAHPELSPGQIKNNAASMHMYGLIGGPQMRMMMATQAGDMFKSGMFDGLDQAMQYVGGVYSGQPSGVQPHMSPEQLEKYGNVKHQLYEAYPGMGENVLDGYAHAQLMGDQKTMDMIKPTMSSSARSGTIAQQQFAATNRLDWARLAHQADNDAGTLNLGIASELAKGGQEAYKNWYELAMNPNSTHDQVNSAFDAMANQLNQQNQIKIKYGGQTFTLGGQDVQSLRNWRPSYMLSGGKAYLSPGQMPNDQMANFTGAGTSGPNPGSLNTQMASAGQNVQGTLMKFAASVRQMPDGPQRVQAFNSIVQTLQQVPPVLRTEYIKQLDLPPDMKLMVNEAANQLSK